ncbi:GGDEF domain-containing protein [bacterium]|nr:GGDEF domain-containing protein [bacterium]
MRLTENTIHPPGLATRPTATTGALIAAAVIAMLAAIFLLDRSTGDAPVQHLYYLPIALAAFVFGRRGGVAAALAAIALYHFANGFLYDPRRGEADILQVALFIAVGVVVAKLRDDAERLRYLASTDDLTGLHNLRSFEARLAQGLRRAHQRRAPLSLLVLDLDRLKSINDRHGHLAGAEAVRTVGAILAATLPADAVACRYGGDEFVVALPDCPLARAEAIARELVDAVHALAPRLAGHALPVGTLSISVGVACHATPGEPAVALSSPEANAGEALFRAADDALYRAKAAGRNRICAA